MPWQSTDGWALRLHSCRALSSQPQVHDTPLKKLFTTFPLTNHIPVIRGLPSAQLWILASALRSLAPMSNYRRFPFSPPPHIPSPSFPPPPPPLPPPPLPHHAPLL